MRRAIYLLETLGFVIATGTPEYRSYVYTPGAEEFLEDHPSGS